MHALKFLCNNIKHLIFEFKSIHQKKNEQRNTIREKGIGCIWA